METELQLEVDDLVMGKVKGYPWWPGKVLKACFANIVID